MKALLENGADPNVKRPAGWTALHHAAHDGHVELIPYLLEYSGDIDGEVSILYSGNISDKGDHL